MLESCLKSLASERDSVNRNILAFTKLFVKTTFAALFRPTEGTVRLCTIDTTHICPRIISQFPMQKIPLPNNRWSNCHAGHARLAKVKIISASEVPTAHPVSYLDGSTAWGPV